MSSQFEFSGDGQGDNLIRRNGRQVGYVKNDCIYAVSAGSSGAGGGQQVGYIRGDSIYAVSAGSSGAGGGQQVGYIRGDSIYAVSAGSSGAGGGTRVGSAAMTHPRWQAAAYFLLT